MYDVYVRLPRNPTHRKFIDASQMKWAYSSKWKRTRHILCIPTLLSNNKDQKYEITNRTCSKQCYWHVTCMSMSGVLVPLRAFGVPRVVGGACKARTFTKCTEGSQVCWIKGLIMCCLDIGSRTEVLTDVILNEIIGKLHCSFFKCIRFFLS